LISGLFERKRGELEALFLITGRLAETSGLTLKVVPAEQLEGQFYHFHDALS
jgi:hypothetical protein